MSGQRPNTLASVFMDGHRNENDEFQGEHSDLSHAVDQTPFSAAKTSEDVFSFSKSDKNNQDLILGKNLYSQPSTSYVDGQDAPRQQRALLAAKDSRGEAKEQAERKNQSSSWHRNDNDGQGSESTHAEYVLGDENHSDFSPQSTIDDVELHQLNSEGEDGLTDDEETGLTKKDNRHRKRRRKHTLQDDDIGGKTKLVNQEKFSADRSVLKALLINTLLIASWYLFSLSISIVGHVLSSVCLSELIQSSSTTNGCSHQIT